MNHARWIGKAAWGLAFVVLVEIALVVVLESTLGPDETYFPVTTALSMIGFGAWAVVAAIVVSRQAAHVVGWLLLAATFFGVSGTLSEVVALRIAAEGGSFLGDPQVVAKRLHVSR